MWGIHWWLLLSLTKSQQCRKHFYIKMWACWLGELVCQDMAVLSTLLDLAVRNPAVTNGFSLQTWDVFFVVNPHIITLTSKWGRWHLKLPASRLFTQRFIQAQITENIKALCHWPLCGEFTGTGEYPAQRASNAENVSIWWRHHVLFFKQPSLRVHWVAMRVMWYHCNALYRYHISRKGNPML